MTEPTYPRCGPCRQDMTRLVRRNAQPVWMCEKCGAWTTQTFSPTPLDNREDPP